MGDKPTKDDLLIGKVGIINSLVKSGNITEQQVAQRIDWLLQEYQQKETPVEIIRRAFGIKPPKSE